MALQKVVVMAKTKLDKNDKSPKVTAITYNFEGVTAEMLVGPALDSLTITKQGEYRRKKVIPQTEEVMVKDMIARMGSRQVAPTVEGVAAAITTLSQADRDALIKRLQEEAKAAAKTGKKGGQQPAAAAQ